MGARPGVALVTGAGTGIGCAFASVFAAAGWRVACVGRRREPLEETVAGLRAAGGEGLALPADVTDYADAERAVAACTERLGGLDLVVNNAGSFASIGPVWEADPARWAADVAVNLLGTFHVCRAALASLRAQNRGTIVTLDGGGGADSVNPGGSAYGASKAGVVRFTETLARELERDGSAVIVFGINPGFVRTAMTRALAPSAWQPFVRDGFAQGWDRPADWCAKSVLHLLDRPDLRALHGATLGEDTDPDAPQPRVMRLVSKER